MSDDLVKRLRDIGYCSPEDVAEAADRIEKLEAALRKIASESKIIASPEDMQKALAVKIGSHRKIARKALEGKDE